MAMALAGDRVLIERKALRGGEDRLLAAASYDVRIVSISDAPEVLGGAQRWKKTSAR